MKSAAAFREHRLAASPPPHRVAPRTTAVSAPPAAAVSRLPAHHPRLTSAQWDLLEETVERAVTTPPAPGRLRGAARAVVRAWRRSAAEAAELQDRRDTVRRELLLTDPRLW